MMILLGIMVVLAGLGFMGFGLWLFYALLPVFYGLLGAGVGLWLGSVLTGNPLGEVGVVELVAAIIGAILFALGAYVLESARRIVTGIFLGMLLGLALGTLLGASTIITVVLSGVFAVGGALLIPIAFDPLIIISSVITGAALVMDGAHLILPGVAAVDRTQIMTGEIVPLVIWIVLGAIGLGWQFSNLSRWVSSDQPV